MNDKEEVTIFFWKEDVEEILNLQPKEGKAKPYQVKQVRLLLIRYKLVEFW